MRFLKVRTSGSSSFNDPTIRFIREDLLAGVSQFNIGYPNGDGNAVCYLVDGQRFYMTGEDFKRFQQENSLT